jgi:energy-coupling factor transporter ATP-binding protein EcfA2
MPIRIKGEPVTVTLLSRDEFLTDYWNYAPGEHVTALGPTGCGKTTLMYQLLGRSTHEKLPGLVLVMKPRDETVIGWNKRLHYRLVRSWPPPISLWQPHRPPGYTVWPKHTFNLDYDNEHMEKVFQRALMDSYRRGDRVVFADELLGLTDDLNLKIEVRTILTRGRSMGCGLWSASQRPFSIPQHAYDQAAHLFLHHDPDERSVVRYSEIGGVDPKLVAAITRQLKRHQFLYLGRRGPVLAVIDR